MRARLKAEQQGKDPDAAGDKVESGDVIQKPSRYKDCHFCGQSTDKMKNHIAKVFKETFANVSKTCRIVGISRGRFYSWIENDPEFKFKINGITERCNKRPR